MDTKQLYNFKAQVIFENGVLFIEMFINLFTEKSSTNTKRRTDKKGNNLVICNHFNGAKPFSKFIYLLLITFLSLFVFI